MARSIAAAALATAACQPVMPWVPPVPWHHVTDRVGVMSTPASAELSRWLDRYERRTEHQIVVWIDDDLPAGVGLEDFAQATFNSWALGRNGVDDGVALFVFVKSRRARIHVGFGLERKLTDAAAVRIIREQIAPWTQAGKWEQGISAGVDAIVEAIGDAR